MKCDELKPLKNLEVAFNTTTEQEQVIAEDNEGNCYGFDSWEEVYLKDEVDAAIAELKQKLEDAKATAYAESVDAGMRERRLKHALWLARAERAADRARIFYFNDLKTMLDIDGYSYDSKKKKGHKKLTARRWRIIWEEVERKCLKKSKEYL